MHQAFSVNWMTMSPTTMNYYFTKMPDIVEFIVLGSSDCKEGDKGFLVAMSSNNEGGRLSGVSLKVL